MKKKKSRVHERRHEFSGEGLQIRDGSLFCSFCHEFVSEKKSSVGAHVKCKKHTLSKAKHRIDVSSKVDLLAKPPTGGANALERCTGVPL